MARPRVPELTQRELEVMHVFWSRGETTVAEVRDALAADGLERAYTTVATLVRILCDKGFLKQTNQERPFRFRPARSRDDVSRRMLANLVEKVFRGSREELVLRLFDRSQFTDEERAVLEKLLRENP